MHKNNLNFKGCISKIYSEENIRKNNPADEIESFYEIIKSFCKQKNIENINSEKYIEISHEFTSGYSVLLDHFKNGVFLSDNAFESLLVHHFAFIGKKNIEVINDDFKPNSLTSLKINESFDLVFSYKGLAFEELYTILPQVIGLLKVGGILALRIPAYWFIKENITETEKTILEYSKQNDKKWIFPEPLEPVIEKNGAELLTLSEIPQNFSLNRFELAYYSSLKKLYDAEIGNNKAHLEILKFPSENLEIRGALLLVRKTKKTVTKDNLFSV